MNKLRYYEEEADYKEQQNPDYKGNPLIEALPKIESSINILKGMVHFPEYCEEERNADDIYRLDRILILEDIVAPLKSYEKLCFEIPRLIRSGYKDRNPFCKDYTIKLNSLADGLHVKNKKPMILDLPGRGNLCLTILGTSGCGKSLGVQKLISLYPVKIQHKSNFCLEQIVWIYINCPAKGTINGLCENFFQEYDTIMGTHHYETVTRRRDTVASMMVLMKLLAYRQCLGVLVIDEIQQLLDCREGPKDVLNFLVTLTNTIGVPIILVGNPEITKLLTSTLKQARRASSQGEIYIDRLKNDKEWRIFLKSIWRYQWTKIKTDLTEELANLMYEETQGIVNITIKLYRKVQEEAIRSGEEEITIKLIKKVRRTLKLTEPMLNALRSGERQAIKSYPDISLDDNTTINDLKDIKNKMIDEKELQEQKNKNEKKLLEDKIFRFLIEQGRDIYISHQVTLQVIENMGVQVSLDILQREALKQVLNLEISKSELNK